MPDSNPPFCSRLLPPAGEVGDGLGVGVAVAPRGGVEVGVGMPLLTSRKAQALSPLAPCACTLSLPGGVLSGTINERLKVPAGLTRPDCTRAPSRYMVTDSLALKLAPLTKAVPPG